MSSAPFPSFDAQATPSGTHLTIQTASCELNVRLTTEELVSYTPERLAEASWPERTPLRMGMCCSKPVFWSVDQGRLSVLVGDDDEVWEVGLVLPGEAVEALSAAMEQARNEETG